MKHGMKIMFVVGMTAMLAVVMMLSGCKKDNGSTSTVTGVSLDNTMAILTSGCTMQLNYTVSPIGAAVENEVWSTSDSKVATVSKGLVTGIAGGIAVIRITINSNITDSCMVTVQGGGKVEY